MYVQFSDATESTLVAVFSCPQDADTYANQGTVLPSDARYATFFNSLSASTQKELPPPG